MFFNRRGKSFYHSVSILIGTIVGVGVFGIPFSFAKAGFLTGLLFLVFIGALSLAVNLIFGEIVLRTNGPHQFTGYAGLYLNKWAKTLAGFAWFLGIYAALLAYVIISGNFLFNLFISQFYAEPFVYSVLFFVFVALATLRGLKTVAWFEFFMVFFFSLIAVLVFIIGIPKMDTANLTTLFNKEFWFLPYGVLLFAYAGFSAVPIQKEVIGHESGLLKRSIIWGSLIPAALYLIFAVSIVGIAGDTTSPDVVSGLAGFLDYRVIFLVSLFGFLAITTSFMALAFALIETFRFDFKMKKSASWALAVFVPFLLFLFGVRNFIEVIALAGSVAIGIEGMLLVLMYKKAKRTGDRQPEYSLNFPPWFLNGIALLFAVGAVYALFFE